MDLPGTAMKAFNQVPLNSLASLTCEKYFPKCGQYIKAYFAIRIKKYL